MDAEFSIIEHGSEEWKHAVLLREEILRKPLGSVFSKEELEEERNHVQVVGKIENKIIATAVLVPEEKRVKMQRVVVAEKLRNSNVGSEMMDYCEDFCKREGYDFLYCHARDTAVNFYLKNEYEGEGEYFDEDGIPHLKMIKALG